MDIAWLSPFLGASAVTLRWGVKPREAASHRLRPASARHLFSSKRAPSCTRSGPLTPGIRRRPDDRPVGLKPTTPSTACTTATGPIRRCWQRSTRQPGAVGCDRYIVPMDRLPARHLSRHYRAPTGAAYRCGLIAGSGSGTFWSANYNRLRRAAVPVGTFSMHSYFPSGESSAQSARPSQDPGSMAVSPSRWHQYRRANAVGPSVDPVGEPISASKGGRGARSSRLSRDDWLFQTGRETRATTGSGPPARRRRRVSAWLTPGRRGPRNRSSFVALQPSPVPAARFSGVDAYFLPPR